MKKSNLRTPLSDKVYPLPNILPCSGHPRVLFTKEELPLITENLKKPQNKPAFEAYQRWLSQEPDGTLDESKEMNFNQELLAIIESKAFDYGLTQNEKSGRTAITEIKKVLTTARFSHRDDISREMGLTIFVAAKVYDWCYPLLSSFDQIEIVEGCEKIAAQMETGWPPSDCGAITGHGGEAMLQRDLLAFAIAVYDEFPDIYQFVAGRILSEFVPARNFYFRSGSYHQGTNYNRVRYTFDLWAQWLFYKISGQRIFIEESRRVSYQLLYYTRPDGQLIKEGDHLGETLGAPGEVSDENLFICLLAAGFYKDPYIKGEIQRITGDYSTFYYLFPSFTPVDFLILNDPDLDPLPLSQLPKTEYFGRPNGLMLARTGWAFCQDSSDVVAFMKIGEQWMGNHHHLDSGTFQLYYKGILAVDKGMYDRYGSAQDYHFNKETIAHNGLLIYDPEEQPFQSVNSGGQRRPGEEVPTLKEYEALDYELGKVLGVAWGPDTKDPLYSYISGDLTKAYTDKVSEVRRSMLFMPTHLKETPAVFFVMDKVVAKDPGFKKTFLLHSMQEPQVAGNTTILKRDTDGYNGKLTVQTLYPKNPTINKIGGPGRQWEINGNNYPPAHKVDLNTIHESLQYGWGRVEISPSLAQKQDYFLHAMYVSDGDEVVPVREALFIETKNFMGARLLNQVCLFAKETKPIEAAVSFELQGENRLGMVVAGLAPGQWEIRLNQVQMELQEVSAESGVLYFQGTGGQYQLIRQSSGVEFNSILQGKEKE